MTEAITKEHVAPILKNVVEQIKQKTLMSGFKACGLVPWNPDSTDFSKCLGRNSKKSADNELSKTTPTHPSIKLEQFHQSVGDDLLEKFKTIEDVVLNADMSSEFSNFTVSGRSFPGKIVWVTIKMLFKATVMSYSKRTIHNKTKIFNKIKTFHNTRIMTIRTPLKNRKDITMASEREQIDNSTNSSLSDLLIWPETPIRKGKKQTERVPLVISSKQ